VLEFTAGSGTIGGPDASVINFGSVQFDPDAAWKLVEPPPANGQLLSGFTFGDTLELVGVSESIAGFANGTLSLTGSAPLSLRIPGLYILQQFSATIFAGGTDLMLAPAGREISQSYTSGVTLTNSADNLVRVSGTIDTGSGSALTGAAPTGWTIVNQALLRSTDTAGNGITLAAGGTVLNNAGARIAGGQYGVSIASGAGTVINAGSIAGAEAVQLAAGYANRVVLAPAPPFSGMVNGGNTIGAPPPARWSWCPVRPKRC
jgi:hypothetical protein